MVATVLNGTWLHSFVHDITRLYMFHIIYVIEIVYDYHAFVLLVN